MNVRELMPHIEARALTGETGLDNPVSAGYACDLLSWVMAHGREHMAWVTVQTHMNVIAVATLHEMSCVIIPARRAASRGMTLFSPATAHTRRGMRVSSAGVGPVARSFKARSSYVPSARRNTVQTSPTTPADSSTRMSSGSRYPAE